MRHPLVGLEPYDFERIDAYLSESRIWLVIWFRGFKGLLERRLAEYFNEYSENNIGS